MLNADDAARAASPTQANHVCVVYDDLSDLHARAAAFLLEGVVAGDRLEYLGVGSVAELLGLRAVHAGQSS